MSNNNMHNSFADTYGNRAFSVNRMGNSPRMTAHQPLTQPPPQPNDNNNAHQPSTSGSTGLDPATQQFPPNPFLVLAQVPVQATAFSNSGQRQSQAIGTQSSHPSASAGGMPSPQPQRPQPSQNPSLPSMEGSWEQLLQPTPLAPGHLHGSASPQAGTSDNTPKSRHRESQFQSNSNQQSQQPVQSYPSMDQFAQLFNSGAMPYLMNNTAGNNQFDAATMSFLQELMRNAASAAMQQQQQQQQQQSQQQPMQYNPNRGSNPNLTNMMDQQQSATMMDASNNANASTMISRPFTQRMGVQPPDISGVQPVDSSVGPVSRPRSNSSNSNLQPQGVEGWKQMWDSASKTMFQQQHQRLLGQDKSVDRANGNISSALPVQPAKRKFTDMTEESELQPKNIRTSRTFHPLDSFGSADVDESTDDFLDFTPTPLSEIREQERSEALEGQQQGHVASGTAPTNQSNASCYSEWPNWTEQVQTQTEATSAQPQTAGTQSQMMQSSGVGLPLNKQSSGARQQTFILPSTMMPPTVLASTFTEPASSSNRKRKPGAKSARSETPLDALQRILRERGYGSKIPRIISDEAGYDAVPSPLQLASFGTEVVKAVHTSNAKRLGELLSSGLSPNPCNQFRDSIVDLVCKRANEDIFQCLMEHGSELRVCDGFGRTPLHHCCWASDFSPDITHAILTTDLLQLFIEDKRGQTPLEYVRPTLTDSWVEFLEEHKEQYFPLGGSIPELMNVKGDRPDGSLPDPLNSLPVPLAAAVSSGQVTPEHANSMDDDAKAEFVSQQLAK